MMTTNKFKAIPAIELKLKPMESNDEMIYRLIFNYIFLVTDDTVIELTMDHIIPYFREFNLIDCLKFKEKLVDLKSSYEDDTSAQSKYALTMLTNMLTYKLDLLTKNSLT